jgi:ubiquinone biosynthesis protein UbiJ
MPATAPWVAAAESMINRSIGASSRAAALARRLDNTSLRIEVEYFAPLRAVVHAGHCSLLNDDLAADATLAGTAPELWSLLRGRTSAAAAAANVKIQGSAEIANLYRELLSAARPDPEEELSRWLGDLPARGVFGLARGVAGWSRHVRRTARDNVREYLEEESRDLVGTAELNGFLHAVDGVREAADRVEARLARLERLLQERS